MYQIVEVQCTGRAHLLEKVYRYREDAQSDASYENMQSKTNTYKVLKIIPSSTKSCGSPISVDVQTDYLQLQRDISRSIDRLTAARDTLTNEIKELESIKKDIPYPTDEGYDTQVNQHDLDLITLLYKSTMVIIGNNLRKLTTIGVSFEKPEWLD